MLTDIAAALHLYPLFFPLADHPSNLGQDQYYEGNALIAQKGARSRQSRDNQDRRRGQGREEGSVGDQARARPGGGWERIGLRQPPPSPYGNRKGKEKGRGRFTDINTGQRGVIGRSDRLHPHPRRPPTQGGLQGLGARKFRRPPPQGHIIRRVVAGVVA